MVSIKTLRIMWILNKNVNKKAPYLMGTVLVICHL